MPRFNLTDDEINELTDYMMTVYQNPAIDRDSMPLSGYSQGQIELGKQLFYGKYACQGATSWIPRPTRDTSARR